MTPKKKRAASKSVKKSRTEGGAARSTEEKSGTPPGSETDSPHAAAAVDRPKRPRTGQQETSEERQKRIAEHAYSLFLQRGGEHGRALEDWIRAERQVTEEDSKRP